MPHARGEWISGPAASHGAEPSLGARAAPGPAGRRARRRGQRPKPGHQGDRRADPLPTARGEAARSWPSGSTTRTRFRLLRLGAKGLVRYVELPRHFVSAVREVSSGGFWVPRTLLSRFVDSTLSALRRPKLVSASAHMSRREREVHQLLMENLSNKEIANRLHMSERTVKFHVSNLLGKHGVKRRSDLIMLSFAERKHA